MNNMRFENSHFSSFKHLFILLCYVSFTLKAIAQEKEVDYKFGKITAKDFDVSKSKIVDGIHSNNNV